MKLTYNWTFHRALKSKCATCVVVVLTIFGSSTVQAGDLFYIDATAGLTTVSVGGNSVTDLVDNFINVQGGFAPLNNGNPVNAYLNYAGVHQAISFFMNNTGTSANLSIPSIGFNQNFNGVNRSDTENQIEQFIKGNGSAVFADFLKSMNARSLVAISDGNPNASTARSSFNAYENYSMTFAETQEEKHAPQETSGRVGIGIIADVGSFDANGVKGTVYSLPLFARFKITERLGLNIDLPLNYTEIESAAVYGAGLTIGLPYKIKPKTDNSKWYWQVTPSGGATIDASLDMAAGGLLASGGLSSVAAYDFGRCTLSMGNHFSLHEGMPITISGYRLDPGVSQQITKNGLKLDLPFAQRWIFDVYAIHTKFLSSAALDQYATVGGEIGYRLRQKAGSSKKKGGYMKLGIYSDLGDNFTSSHIQFGSGWKF